MEIDWTLLILLTVGALFVLGLVLALGTSAGKKRLGEGALALAESLLRYAIQWLESVAPGVPDVPGVIAQGDSLDLARAKAAYACLGAASVREIAPEDAR